MYPTILRPFRVIFQQAVSSFQKTLEKLSTVISSISIYLYLYRLYRLNYLSTVLITPVLSFFFDYTTVSLFAACL